MDITRTPGNSVREPADELQVTLEQRGTGTRGNLELRRIDPATKGTIAVNGWRDGRYYLRPLLRVSRRITETLDLPMVASASG